MVQVGNKMIGCLATAHSRLFVAHDNAHLEMGVIGC